MRNILLYENIVRGAGIGHTLMCYNHAVQTANQKNQKLVVPKCIMGHYLGDNFEFEDFFGLDINSGAYIASLPKDDVEIIPYMSDPLGENGCNQNHYFSPSKEFFMDRFTKTMPIKIKRYSSHLVPGKINIAINIRRGDIVYPASNFEHHKKANFRIIPDVWFKNALNIAMQDNQLRVEDIHVNIYSETQDGIYLNELAQTTDPKTILGLDNVAFYFSSNMWESLYNIFNADIFIGGNCGIPIVVSVFRDYFKRVTYVEKRVSYYVQRNNFQYVRVLD